MKQVAIYGKGGIGKSTVASNLSMALRERGVNVMQVGCDPKRDSTRNLVGGTLIPTVLETYRENLRMGRDETTVALDDIVHEGSNGILCVEAGGPEPGVGCAGRGVLTAINILRDLKAFDTYGTEAVVYDVLGDVVCGGFAQPIRAGYAREIYLVCSGAFMSIYAANNIAKGVRRLSRKGETGLAGMICNSSGDEALEKSLLPEFARTLGTELVSFIPHSPVIRSCEIESSTVLEHSPQSDESQVFRDLAARIMESGDPVTPTPVEELSELEDLYRKHLPEPETTG